MPGTSAPKHGAVLGLLALLCLAMLQSTEARMVAHRQLAKRAATGPAADLHARQAPPAGNNPAAPAASTTQGGILGGVSDVLGGLSSSTILVPSSSTTAITSSSVILPVSSSAPLSSSLPASSSAVSSSAVLSSSAPVSSSSTRASVINVTSVQTVEASATPSAASQNDDKQEQSTGIGKKTIIIIAAIASAVGLVAAVWTIFRKWKFSPSRRFEDKLNPINWSPDIAGAHRSEDAGMSRNGSQLGLTRSHSGSSNGHDSINAYGVKRTNSWGSHAGSTVGSLRRGDGGMSEVRPNYSAAVPAYPPGYPASNAGGGHGRFDSYGSTDRGAYQSYEQVSRQPTMNVNGGRFGEGYNRR